MAIKYLPFLANIDTMCVDIELGSRLPSHTWRSVTCMRVPRWRRRPGKLLRSSVTKNSKIIAIKNYVDPKLVNVGNAIIGHIRFLVSDFL